MNPTVIAVWQSTFPIRLNRKNQPTIKAAKPNPPAAKPNPLVDPKLPLSRWVLFDTAWDPCLLESSSGPFSRTGPSHVHSPSIHSCRSPMVGDSTTRYQFTSLAFFIHKGYYQPRFGETLPSCLHLGKDGVPVCSLEGEPNVCMEYSWVSVTRPGRDPWNTFMQDLGSNSFDGYMEASTARTSATNHTQIAENYHYVAPAKYNGTAQPLLLQQTNTTWITRTKPDLC
jgi:hypothetical protein